MKPTLRKGDEALVIAGSEKGKKATVMEIDRKRWRVRLQNTKIQTHFDKKEGIQKKEGWLDYSNVKLIARSKTPPSKKKQSVPPSTERQKDLIPPDGQIPLKP